MTAENAAAKIGDTYYATFEEALVAATASDTIDMCADATPVLTDKEGVAYVLTDAAAINLNGHVLTFNQGNIKFKKNFTFNGKAAGATSESEKGKIVIMYDITPITYNGSFWVAVADTKVTFNDVIIDANKLKDTYLLECWAENTSAEFNNCDITAISTNDSASVSALLCCNADGTSIVINNTDIDFKNIDGHLVFNSDVTVKGDSEITASNVASGFCALVGNKTIKIEDTAVLNITNITGTHSWNPEHAGIVLGANIGYTKADTAQVNSTIYKTVTADNAANKVEVKFVPTAEANVYDIVVVPTDNAKAINRLSAAEFDFELNNSAMSFEVAGADNVNVTRDDDDHILFNFDGVHEADASGVEVKLGTVKIGGYGTFTFGIKADGNNKVQTATVNDNIVYTAEAANLTVSNTIAATVTVPTKALTINVEFPNKVTDNAKAYQDMKVTVVGGTVNEEYDLGEDMTAEGKYVVATNLPENITYTVTVTGAGYRTARCNVTMTDNKTLNFWNNVKDSAAEVETGNAASAKTTTFLAGELVKDGKINIYDLSAVVSYFGTTNDTASASDYAKYDLNRDGKIDSKDVAYVLVSWGK